MKKFLVVLLSAVLMALFIGCGGKQTEPFELDADISGNGLTVYYPSSWTGKNSGSNAYIYPPCGGAVNIMSRIDTGTGISKDSAESLVDTYADKYYEKLNQADIEFTFSKDKVREVKGDALIEIRAFTAINNGIASDGYSYLAFVDGNTAAIIAMIPSDAEPEYLATLKSIVESAEYSSVADQSSDSENSSSTDSGKAKGEAEAPIDSDGSSNSESSSDYDWKTFLDDYETFADSYVVVLQNALENPTDLTTASEAAKLAQEASEWSERIKELEASGDLSAEDQIEFAKETIRITQKITDSLIQ